MYQTRAQFQNLQKALGAQLEATAGQFLNSRGIPFETSNLDQMSISPKDLASEYLMLGGDIWPDDSAASPLPAQSIFRPLLWTLGSLLVTLPIGITLYELTGFGAYTSLLAGIVTISTIFGMSYGLLLSAVTPFLSNLLVVPPILTFTAPTRMEIAYAVIYATMAVIVPMAIRLRPKLRLLAFSI